MLDVVLADSIDELKGFADTSVAHLGSLSLEQGRLGRNLVLAFSFNHLLNLTGRVDKLEDDSDEAANDLQLKAALDRFKVQLHQALKEVRETTEGNELLLPAALLVICF